MQETYLYLLLSGFQGVLAGLLVGIKQMVPDQELYLLKIKAKWLPSLILLLSIAISFFTRESEFLRPVIDPIASIFHWMLCRRTKTSGDAHGNTVGGATLLGSDPVEASRRRYSSRWVGD